MTSDLMILLDTCTLLWLTSDQSKLSETAKGLLKKGEGNLFVSSISAFEIAVKAKKKKLELPMEAEKWFHKAIDFHGLVEIPVNGSIAVLSTRLPPLHADPCDRMIIATAQLHDLTLLTPDSRIADYPRVRTAW